MTKLKEIIKITIDDMKIQFEEVFGKSENQGFNNNMYSISCSEADNDIINEAIEEFSISDGESKHSVTLSDGSNFELEKESY